MQFLKNMGGGAFGGAKPAAPAKQNYFSSLKLEYSFRHSETRRKKCHRKRIRGRVRNLVHRKASSLKNSHWTSRRHASVASFLCSPGVPRSVD